MIKVGFAQGKASLCTYSHAGTGLRCYMHGDDSVTVGTDKALKWMKQELETSYEIKTQVSDQAKKTCSKSESSIQF